MRARVRRFAVGGCLLFRVRSLHHERGQGVITRGVCRLDGISSRRGHTHNHHERLESGAVAVGGTGDVCNPANGGTCTFTIANGTQITLAANSPATPGIFSAGTGDAAACGPTSTCKFTLTTDSSIVASFNAGSVSLHFKSSWLATAKVKSSPNNNRCQNFELGYSACTTYFAVGSEVTMQGAFDARQHLQRASRAAPPMRRGAGRPIPACSP